MTNVVKLRSEESVPPPPFAPGFLFERLGWIVDWLKGAIQSDPDLLTDIYSLTRQRMHLIGLALAHLDGPAGKNLAPFLLRGRGRDILDYVLGYRPRGLKRAIENLSWDILSPKSYRLLTELLRDPASFRILSQVSFIDDDDLERISRIPAELRSFMSPSDYMLYGDVIGGLELLVQRGVAASYELLMDELKVCRQQQQLEAHLRRLINSLPQTYGEPPATVGSAHRLDGHEAICELSRRWKNCLKTNYLPDVNDGKCAIYLWDSPDVVAACAVERYGRLGWLLSEVLGPRNAEIPSEKLAFIQQKFAEVDILRASGAKAIYKLSDMSGSRRRRR